MPGASPPLVRTAILLFFQDRGVEAPFVLPLISAILFGFEVVSWKVELKVRGWGQVMSQTFLRIIKVRRAITPAAAKRKPLYSSYVREWVSFLGEKRLRLGEINSELALR
jgi:hypothetical protein